MKTNETKITANFDLELLSILKNDIVTQHVKMKHKLINLATKSYDNDLLNIIKEDLLFIKSQICNQSGNLAKAS